MIKMAPPDDEGRAKVSSASSTFPADFCSLFCSEHTGGSSGGLGWSAGIDIPVAPAMTPTRMTLSPLDEAGGGGGQVSSSAQDSGGGGGGALGGAPTSTSIADTVVPRVLLAMAGLARAVLVSVSTSSTLLPAGMAITIDMENSEDSESRRLPETALPFDSLIRLPVASRTVIVTYAASTPEAFAILVLMSSTTDGLRNSSKVPVTLSSTTTEGGGDGGGGGGVGGGGGGAGDGGGRGAPSGIGGPEGGARRGALIATPAAAHLPTAWMSPLVWG